MEDFDIISSSTSDSDESAEIENLIASFKKEILNSGKKHGEDNEDGRSSSTTTTNNQNRRKKKKKMHTKTKSTKSKTAQSHSLDYLKQRISELLDTFEDHGLFIPPPESMSEKGKVWSSRIYGADKKRQRKNTERALLEDRIKQLEDCLTQKHAISV